MWQPHPGWHPLTGGSGGSTVGVWRTVLGDQAVVVKRLAAPVEGDPTELSEPRHFAYWRRAGRRDHRGPRRGHAGAAVAAPRLRSRRTRKASPSPRSGSRTPRAAACSSPMPSAGSRAVTSRRRRGWPATSCGTGCARVERHGGWRTLARTTVADVADHSGRGARELLAAVDALRAGAGARRRRAREPARSRRRRRARDRLGDARARTGGRRPGLLPPWRPARSSSRCSTPTCWGCPRAWRPASEVTLGARVTAVYTVLNRAEWALSRVAGGEGALAGKYRHPAVAPHLRALQRQFPQIEALVTG